MFLSSEVKSQDQHIYNREWLAVDGRRLVGAIESIDLDRDDPIVRILVKGAVAIDIRLDKLSEVDQAYVRLQQINADDRQQFEFVARPHEAIRATPQSVAGILQQIGRDRKLSPYASVWCCIANAAGDNDQEKGIVACRDAIRRINEQRKLDPPVMPELYLLPTTTLVSAILNNATGTQQQVNSFPHLRNLIM